MKKLMFLLLIAGVFSQAQAQKMVVKDVPAAVVSSFNKAYPSIANVDWNKDGNNYEAQYNASNLDKSVTYDTTGVLVQSSSEILVSALPAPVMVYVNKNYLGDNVITASKVTDAKNVVTFDVQLKEKNLIFDSSGTFIRSEISLSSL